MPEIGAVTEKINEYRESNDAIYSWSQEFVKPLGFTDKTYVLGNFYEHFVVWCGAEGRHAVSKIHFGRKLLDELKSRYPNILITKPGNKTACCGAFTITASPGKYERKYEEQGELDGR